MESYKTIRHWAKGFFHFCVQSARHRSVCLLIVALLFILYVRNENIGILYICSTTCTLTNHMIKLNDEIHFCHLLCFRHTLCSVQFVHNAHIMKGSINCKVLYQSTNKYKYPKK